MEGVNDDNITENDSEDPIEQEIWHGFCNEMFTNMDTLFGKIALEDILALFDIEQGFEQRIQRFEQRMRNRDPQPPPPPPGTRVPFLFFY